MTGQDNFGSGKHAYCPKMMKVQHHTVKSITYTSAIHMYAHVRVCL